ncbi:transposase [Polaromonas sp.]|uniref:IS66 family transposase n=1 Tax=Polaromonas sp. TaxID=1869339 RepID=UPI003266EE9B
MWSYCTTAYNETRAMVFDSADSYTGEHVRDFLGLPGEGCWHGSLICDDFSGDKTCFAMGVTEARCFEHVRCKVHELWADYQSTVGERALRFFISLYDIQKHALRHPHSRKG